MTAPEIGGIELPDDLLDRFEHDLDPARPEASPIPTQVLGYGEMSTVLALDVPGYEHFAFKRMALFRNDSEVAAYEATYHRYISELRARGLQLPDYGVHAIAGKHADAVTLYLSQTRLDAASIANKAMHVLRRDESVALLRRILEEAAKVFRANAAGAADAAETTDGTGGQNVLIALDSQVSNWSIEGFDPDCPRFTGDEALLYIDVTTPLLRVRGEEQLDPELFLRICPSYLVWIVRLLFLQDVLDRYYDFRLAAVDVLANFIKERLDDLLADALDTANEFLAGEAYLAPFSPITSREVRGYYRQDAFVWRLFLALRRFERFTRTKLRHRPYDVILPGKITR